MGFCLSEGERADEMTYGEFKDFVKRRCTYETMYEDTDGRYILVIRLMDAYTMVNDIVEEELKNDTNSN